MKKAQAAIEYVILISILMVFLIPIIDYALNESVTSVRVNQLENSARRIAKAVNTVYALGPGTVEIVTVTFPTGIESTAVTGNEILLNVTIYGSYSDVHYPTKANVSGWLPTNPGTYRIAIKMLNNLTVDVRPR